MTTRSRSLLLALVALAASCSDGVGPPRPFLLGEAASLEFTASMARTRIGVGDTASIVFTLRNPGSTRVQLDFGSSCQIIPTVMRGRDKVHPQPFGCRAVVTAITLEPGAKHVVTLPFFTATPDDLARMNWTGLAVTPGTYVSFAELIPGRGRSTSIRFTVLPR